MSDKKSIFITEEEKLKRHLQTTHEERFYILLNLIKINRQIKEAKIVKANS